MEPPNRTFSCFYDHLLLPFSLSGLLFLLNMDTTAHSSQGINGLVKSMEEKKITNRPQALINCPRCNSTHTKFCYYNNYSLSQPRYFCKTCRRYWTEGGSLRNVPVGGGSRKHKRSSPSISSSNNQMVMAPPVPSLISQNPSKHMIQSHGGQNQSQSQSQDLNLTNASPHPGFVDFPYSQNSGNGASSRQLMMMMMNPFLPNTMMMMNSPGLNFSSFQNGGGYHHDDHDHNSPHGGGSKVISHQETDSTTVTTNSTSVSVRPFFPFEDLKQPITSEVVGDQSSRGGGHGDSSSNIYWSGGLGGESW